MTYTELSTDVELAWAAGFFDGEGSTNLSKTGSGLYLRLTITQNDREVLDRFMAAVGDIGNIRGPLQYKYNKSPWYMYAITGRRAYEVLDQLFPYLSTVKKSQAITTIEMLIVDGPASCSGNFEQRKEDAEEFLSKWITN